MLFASSHIFQKNTVIISISFSFTISKYFVVRESEYFPKSEIFYFVFQIHFDIVSISSIIKCRLRFFMKRQNPTISGNSDWIAAFLCVLFPLKTSYYSLSGFASRHASITHLFTFLGLHLASTF